MASTTSSDRGALDVICVGILVADFFPNPIDRFPNQGELMTIDSVNLSTGGCAANTAGGLAVLGLRNGVIGKVGDDVFGRFILEDLEKRGIDASSISISQNSSTSKTIIITIKGEDRRYLHLLGANSDFTLDDVDFDYVAGAKALYIGGFLGMANFNAHECRTLLEYAKKRNIITLLDVITPESGDYLSFFREVLPFVDYFLPNNDEAELICGESGTEKQEEYFLDLGAGTVVITLGAQGVVAKSAQKTIKAGCYSVPFLDGSGAGDAFDAGFIYALLQGRPLEDAVAYGSAMGASCVRQLGCLAGLFNRDELSQFVAEHPLETTGLPENDD